MLATRLPGVTPPTIRQYVETMLADVLRDHGVRLEAIEATYLDVSTADRCGVAVDIVRFRAAAVYRTGA